MITNFTIGADPELFIINTKTDSVVSSIGIIPGVKGEPWRDETMPEGYGIEIDNILGEFNIPVAKTKEEFVSSINYMKNYIRNFVKDVNKDYDIRCIASQYVPEDQLQSPEAKLFGCSVDYNAYTEEPNEKPKGEKTNLRSAGFHIHVGYNKFNADDSIKLIKYLDAYVGIPSVVLDPDTKRRSLYGKAGAFRLTKYGCEYRVLSSFMMSNDSLLSTVWDGIMKAIDAFNVNAPLPNENDVINCINNSDVELAKKLISKYNIV